MSDKREEWVDALWDGRKIEGVDTRELVRERLKEHDKRPKNHKTYVDPSNADHLGCLFVVLMFIAPLLVIFLLHFHAKRGHYSDVQPLMIVTYLVLVFHAAVILAVGVFGVQILW